jgi:hypothetical protein
VKCSAQLPENFSPLVPFVEVFAVLRDDLIGAAPNFRSRFMPQLKRTKHEST